MKWSKNGTVIKSNGEKIIFYNSDTGLKIESRRRPIPHANGVGSWLYTSYFLIQPDGTEKEYHSLKDAKEAAE